MTEAISSGVFVPATMHNKGSVMTLFRLTALFAICIGSAPTLWADERPNIVWILSEDNSVHYLGLYREPLAATPAIEQLAAEGLVYDYAFSCAPVCSVARTTLMSGLLAPRIGFQYHRKQKLAKLPDGVQLFPAYLRQAGYYTTNNSKKDYNVVEGKVWDESSKKASWRNRPNAATPFFHMQSIGISHENSLHFPLADIRDQNVVTDPKQVTPAPYHPDTETFRFTQARYIDRIQQMDKAVGRIIQQLAEDDLLDDTIVFYFGDHGGVLPRSKGYLYETGLHVPLVVRVPEKWRDQLGVEPGQRRQGFVNFTDLGPTVLNLAGVSIPGELDGRPILGSGVDLGETESRDVALGYADRFDEKSDFCRSLRVGHWKYIRNFEPFLPDGMNNNYRYKQLAFAEWRELYRDGKLNDVQRQFFEGKPVEALFDLNSDPFEIRNLATDPTHHETLLQMRGLLTEQLKTLPDLSFYPESELIESALPDGHRFGQQHAAEIAQLIDTANLALQPSSAAQEKVVAALESDNRWQRYWGCLVVSSWSAPNATLLKAVQGRLQDDCLLVRVRAAECLALHGDYDPRPVLFQALESSTSPSEVLLMLNTVVFLRDHVTDLTYNIQALEITAVNDQVERRLSYLAEASPLASH